MYALKSRHSQATPSSAGCTWSCRSTSVKEAVQSPYLARFESFEVNLRSGQLCKNGERIRLPEQSFQILAMLLESADGVVVRQDIQKRLWPDDTVVEFENSISAAIKRLRVALGDSADQPRYIETLARRGYRWKVPVAWIEHPASAMRAAAVPIPVPGPDPSTSTPINERVSQDRSEIISGRRWLAAVAGGMVLAAGIATLTHLMIHRTPKLTSEDSIVVADFSNTTGDPVFNGTLRQGIVSEVEQSPYLNILSDEQIAGTLRLMGQAPGKWLTHDLARQVCQRTGGVAVLDGFIAQIGSQYSLVLNALDCSTGALLGSAQATASDKNHVLRALTEVSSSIRNKLGESLASIQKFNTPLEEVTTPSLEALQAYTLGWQANLNGDESAAVGSFQRAISLDPNFAMAYAALGTAYGGIGESQLAVENMRKAYDQRDRVSEREKFYISSHYEENVTGHVEKAVQIYELWALTYPRDVVPVGRLGFYYTGVGQYQKSLAAGRRALELAPNRGLPYELLVSSYLYLDRLDEAVDALQQAKARGIDSQPLHEAGYALSFLRGDTEGMAREQGWAAGRPGIEDLFLDLGSDSAAYAGQLVQANAMTARAVAMARQAGKKETATTYLAEAAIREALVGNLAEARKRASAALQASNGRDTEAGLALALAADLPRAQKFADDLGRQFPQDAVNLPTIRAVIALGQNLPAKAISDLQAASPYEFVEAGGLTLYPAYVRGQAYLAERQGVAAAAEFQKILDHRGLALNEIISPLAHLGLGRARVLSGDSPGARKAYQDFFALWQHADPDLQILQQAKAEFARLR